MRALSWLLAGLVVWGGVGCGDDGGGGGFVAEEDAGEGEAGDGGGDVEEEVDPASWETLADRPCPEDSVLTWESFGEPFVLNWCTGCHHSALPEGQRADAPLGIDLETLAQVQTWAPRIWARSADLNATMPPYGGPDAEERARLGEWLACGAP